MDEHSKSITKIYDELLLKYTNGSDKDKVFLEIINFINKNANLFDSKFLITLFDLIDDNKKVYYWNLFVKNVDVPKKFMFQEALSLLNLLKTMDERIEVLSLLVENDLIFLLQEKELYDVINYFEDKKYLVLDLLIEHNLINKLNDYQVKELIFSLPRDVQKEILVYFRKKLPDMLDDYVLLWIIQQFDSDVIPDLFHELIINDEKFSEDVLFRNLGCDIDTNLTFELIDLYISEKCKKYNYQEKKQLCDKVKKYIIDYSEFVCEEYPDGKILYDEINRLTCEEYHFNIENFTTFVSLFGYEVYHFIDCINIIKLLKLDTKTFMLILNLFAEKYTFLDQHTLNNVLNAFYQREFMLEMKDDYTIFGTFENLIKDKNKSEILKKLKVISKTIDLSYELTRYQLSYDEFINKLLDYDHDAKEILHKITNKYLMTLREQYVSSKICNAHQDLDLIIKVDKNVAKKELFNNKSTSEIIKLLFSIKSEKLSNKQITLLNNKQLLEKIIEFKKRPYDDDFDNEFYQALSELEKMINILWEDEKLSFNNKDSLKCIYFPKRVNNNYLLNILVEVDIDNISNNLVSNRLMYENLTRILKTYKIMGWGKTFDLLSKKIDLPIDDSTIAGIINYFYVIYPEISLDKHLSLTKLITYGNCYSSVSNKYAYLFGDEEYRLLCANSGVYKAPAPRNKRLELAVNHLIEMYQKDCVTIPSFDQNYFLNNNKVINVVVGNSTSLVNLTIGERTDSCLRICGIFYELYKFIIKDKNGFNICFYDQDGQFISRASGIRNGNTIFLNQLRDSLSTKINNSDLYDALTLVCNDLIKLSSDSEVPIDNVVISPQCALVNQEDKVQYIGEDVFANELYKLPFNYDMDGYALLVASRIPGKYTKKKANNNLPLYKCCADKVILLNDCEQANKRFIQFRLINGLLNGLSLDQISLSNTKIKQCLSTDKFLIVQDYDNEVFSIILDKFKDDINIQKQVDILLKKINFSNTGGIKR